MIRVLDGDTIEVSLNEKETKIRLYGIDAPETDQEYGNESTIKLDMLLKFEDKIKLTIKDIDRYGRKIAEVYIKNKESKEYDTNVNILMLEHGLSWHYKRYSKDKNYSTAEKNAKEKKIGIWSKIDSVPPWEYRKISR